MLKPEKEIWDLINPDSWTKQHVAEAGDGRVVSPFDPAACRFSLVGGLIYCYLEQGEIWSPLFENRRSILFRTILTNPDLHKLVHSVLNYTTLKKIPLQELNQRVDVKFICVLLERAKKINIG